MFFRKKLFAGLLAAALVLTQLPGSALAEGGDLEGDGHLADVIYEVLVPTDLSFAIDPFGVTTTGAIVTASSANQIAGTNYMFANKTIAPVRVGLAFTVSDRSADTSADDKVTIVATAAAVALDDLTVTNKAAYLNVIGADAINATAAGVTITATSVGYNVSATSGTLATFNTSGEAATAFVMAAGDGTNVTNGSAGMAAFTFYGLLNTYAEWETKDIAIDATYTLNALRKTTYDAAVITAVGVNQVPVSAAEDAGEPEVLVGAIFDGSNTAPAKTYSKGSPADIVYSFNAMGGTVAVSDPGGAWISGTDYAYNDATKTLTLKVAKITARWGASPNADKPITIAVTGGSNSGSYTANLTIGN